MKNIAAYAYLALIIVIALVLQSIESLHDTLTFKSEVLASRPWALLTAHFIHLDWAHALTNLVYLVVLYVYWSRLFDGAKIIITAIACGAVIGMLLSVLPYDIHFVGSSGIIHGLLVYAVFTDRNTPLRWLLLTMVLIKVAAELSGWRPEHFVGEHVAYIHAAGVISGAYVALIKSHWESLKKQGATNE